MGHDHTRRRPNYPKADYLFFCKCFDKGIYAVSSVGSLSKRLVALCDLLRRAEAVHIKAVCKREIPWMNAQLNQFIVKHNKLQMDLRTNHRSGWRQTVRSPDSQEIPIGQPGPDTLTEVAGDRP